jgi:hypothetical protein
MMKMNSKRPVISTGVSHSTLIRATIRMDGAKHVKSSPSATSKIRSIMLHSCTTRAVGSITMVDTQSVFHVLWLPTRRSFLMPRMSVVSVLRVATISEL